MARAANLAVPALGGVELPERYSVKGHIARGGMAIVWRAEDRMLHGPGRDRGHHNGHGP